MTIGELLSHKKLGANVVVCYRLSLFGVTKDFTLGTITVNKNEYDEITFNTGCCVDIPLSTPIICWDLYSDVGIYVVIDERCVIEHIIDKRVRDKQK